MEQRALFMRFPLLLRAEGRPRPARPGDRARDLAETAPGAFVPHDFARLTDGLYVHLAPVLACEAHAGTRDLRLAIGSRNLLEALLRST